MYFLEYASQFKKDFKKITKRSVSDIIDVGRIISKLQNGESLEAKYSDHGLSGSWQGFRDCHIKPDLVLVYRVDGDCLQLARIGSHSDLF